MSVTRSHRPKKASGNQVSKMVGVQRHLINDILRKELNFFEIFERISEVTEG